MSGSQASQNPFRFSTKFSDDESGLVYYGYRYYNASMGRWISRDPAGEGGGINAYAFTANCPQEAVDTDGRFPVVLIPIAAIGAEVGWGYHNLMLSLDIEPAAPLWKTVDDCKIDIYAAHGFQSGAFNGSDELKDPTSLARLDHPILVKGTPCSSGTIVACNAAKYARVIDGIPDYELSNRDITMRTAIRKEVEDALAKARVHAKTVCSQCKKCRSIGIEVVWGGSRYGPGFLKNPQPYYGHMESVPCK